jgi:chromosome segregation ATPase
VPDKEHKKKIRALERRRNELTEKIEAAEARVHEINDLFCDPSYFDRTPHKEVHRIEQEQKSLNENVAQLLELWEEAEKELELLQG